MKEYIVTIREVCYETHSVEAASKEEVMEIWEGRIGSYCFYCASSAVVEESEIVEIELRKEEYQLEEEE